MARKTLVIDLDRCIGCYSCEVACKTENNVQLGIYWNKVLRVGPTGTFPEVKMYYLPTVCQECDDPPCVDVCPTGSTYKRDDGVVIIDRETCIGCELCVPACPYEARTFNYDTMLPEKCTTCVQLQDIGELPACVKACPGNARFFGDLDDPQSDASRALASAGEGNVHSMPDVGNHPSGRYILHARNGAWMAPKAG